MSIRINETRSVYIGNSQMIFVKYSDVHNDNAQEIADHTVQTWQQNRGYRETLSNTIQGKIAEDLFQEYLSVNYPDIHILSYDEIRNDGFQKHAAFDFLIWRGECCIDEIIRSIKNDISSSNNYVNISARSRELCRRENVRIAEIKSTKITERHKQQCSINAGAYDSTKSVHSIAYKINQDDFLVYPKYCRRTKNSNFNENNYIALLNERGLNIRNRNEMLDFEMKNQLCDIFVRIYVDETEHAGFIVGWIDKQSFYRRAEIKRMPQIGKSESALYFAAPLTICKSLDNLRNYLSESTDRL